VLWAFKPRKFKKLWYIYFMNRLILIFALCAFLVGGLSEAAHAAMANAACTHQAGDALPHANAKVSNNASDCETEKTQDQADLDQCQHCCCIHAHVFLVAFADGAATIALAERITAPMQVSSRSRDHAPLYRPPIA
tara:strand:- start:47356 stop:47763 length:408 start_codon:yes stop_codon:yes gene_type:complete